MMTSYIFHKRNIPTGLSIFAMSQFRYSNRLKLQGVDPFMPIIYNPLLLTRFGDRTHRAINKPKAVVYGGTFTCDGSAAAYCSRNPGLSTAGFH